MSLGIVTGIADRAAALGDGRLLRGDGDPLQALLGAGRLLVEPARQGRTLVLGLFEESVFGRGFLLITVGPDGSGFAPFLAHPLASSHPYESYHP